MKITLPASMEDGYLNLMKDANFRVLKKKFDLQIDFSRDEDIMKRDENTKKHV